MSCSQDRRYYSQYSSRRIVLRRRRIWLAFERCQWSKQGVEFHKQSDQVLDTSTTLEDQVEISSVNPTALGAIVRQYIFLPTRTGKFNFSQPIIKFKKQANFFPQRMSNPHPTPTTFSLQEAYRCLKIVLEWPECGHAKEQPPMPSDCLYPHDSDPTRELQPLSLKKRNGGVT